MAWCSVKEKAQGKLYLFTRFFLNYETLLTCSKAFNREAGLAQWYSAGLRAG
jgi:hypothetical protein